MSSETWVKLILSAVTYTFFHWAYFRYASDILEKPKLSGMRLVITYVLNFSLFLFVTRYSFHLCVNWTLIYLLFFLEIEAIYRRPLVMSALTALDGAATGLAANIFTRCIAAIILDRPLAHFDNNMGLSVNIKAYPVSIGFMLAAFMLWWSVAQGQTSQRKMVFLDRSGTRFFLAMKSIMYLFLLLNLLAYYTPGNSLNMKLWGIKSAVFVIIGASVANYYVSRLSRNRDFKKKIQEEREELLKQTRKQEQTRYLAFTDLLTGCYNQAYLKELFEELEDTEESLVLCFLDLDNLKHVNDTYGHMEGDRYLRKSSDLMRTCIDGSRDLLFRYGGDEFVILYRDRSAEDVRSLMHMLKKRVAACGNSEEFSYPMSVSCGIAFQREAKDLYELLKLADARMYEDKRAKKEAEGQ